MFILRQYSCPKFLPIQLLILLRKEWFYLTNYRTISMPVDQHFFVARPVFSGNSPMFSTKNTKKLTPSILARPYIRGGVVLLFILPNIFFQRNTLT